MVHDNVVYLSYGRGKILAGDLEKAVNNAKETGKCPMAVVATAGTTVLGAFDSFIEISAVCRKHDLWIHVDVS